jgi:hypothetical protein
MNAATVLFGLSGSQYFAVFMVCFLKSVGPVHLVFFGTFTVLSFTMSMSKIATIAAPGT